MIITTQYEAHDIEIYLSIIRNSVQANMQNVGRIDSPSNQLP
jgi:uncharacterized protein YnzC (UPF0291/DUF896 family)